MVVGISAKIFSFVAQLSSKQLLLVFLIFYEISNSANGVKDHYPLLIFVNGKSGGGQGEKVLEELRYYFSRYQVWFEFLRGKFNLWNFLLGFWIKRRRTASWFVCIPTGQSFSATGLWWRWYCWLGFTMSRRLTQIFTSKLIFQLCDIFFPYGTRIRFSYQLSQK